MIYRSGKHARNLSEWTFSARVFDNYGRNDLTEIDCVNWFNATLVLFDSEIQAVYEWIHRMRGDVE